VGSDKISGFIVVISVGMLIAFGFSLAYLDFRKRKEYAALYTREKRRERWECDNYIEGEQREMVELYMEKGLTKADAETVVNVLSKDKAVFVEVMMKEELQMIQPDESILPFKNSLLLFASTVIFGMLPLFPYLTLWFGMTEWGFWFNVEHAFLVSVFISLSMMFAAGVSKAFYTVTPWWQSGLQDVSHGFLLFVICVYTSSCLQVLQ